MPAMGQAVTIRHNPVYSIRDAGIPLPDAIRHGTAGAGRSSWPLQTEFPGHLQDFIPQVPLIFALVPDVRAQQIRRTGNECINVQPTTLALASCWLLALSKKSAAVLAN